MMLLLACCEILDELTSWERNFWRKIDLFCSSPDFSVNYLTVFLVLRWLLEILFTSTWHKFSSSNTTEKTPWNTHSHKPLITITIHKTNFPNQDDALPTSPPPSIRFKNHPSFLCILDVPRFITGCILYFILLQDSTNHISTTSPFT